jgi:hypothetical protein
VLRLLLRSAQHGASLADLARADWTWSLRETIGETAFQLLEKLAPEQVQLPRRRVAVILGNAPGSPRACRIFWGCAKARAPPAKSAAPAPAPPTSARWVTLALAGFGSAPAASCGPAQPEVPAAHWPGSFQQRVNHPGPAMLPRIYRPP